MSSALPSPSSYTVYCNVHAARNSSVSWTVDVIVARPAKCASRLKIQQQVILSYAVASAIDSRRLRGLQSPVWPRKHVDLSHNYLSNRRYVANVLQVYRSRYVFESTFNSTLCILHTQYTLCLFCIRTCRRIVENSYCFCTNKEFIQMYKMSLVRSAVNSRWAAAVEKIPIRRHSIAHRLADDPIFAVQSINQSINHLFCQKKLLQ